MYDLTAIILCYNRLEYTKLCLDTFIEYAPKNHAMSIVDNGSTDGTREYLKERFKDAPNVHLEFPDTNLMPALGNKLGLEKAQPSKAYLLCDNDGMFENTEWYDVGMDLLTNVKDIGIVGLRNSRWVPDDPQEKFSVKRNNLIYYPTERVASFSLLNKATRDKLATDLKGKWIGHQIARIVKGIGLQSVVTKPGFILDQSDEDLNNPKFREQYLKLWEEKNRTKEFERRTGILNKEKNDEGL